MNLRNIETRLNRIKTPERYRILKPIEGYPGMTLQEYHTFVDDFWKNTPPGEKVYRIQG